MADPLVTLTADIVAAHVSHNAVATDELPLLIESIHAALRDAANPPLPAPEKKAPAVSIRSSVKPDHIVCLEDGVKLKMLKRHLRTRYDMSPDDYRAKWGLPHDYPMVAPSYGDIRRTLAKTFGLGHRRKAVMDETPVAKPARKPRASKPSGGEETPTDS